MSEDEHSVEIILEGVEAIMASKKQPKVLLFDIGGVCVMSPFQAILDYEIEKGIPPGWANYAISKASPNGAWQSLERGAIPMDEQFFAGFKRDLTHPQRWQAFYSDLLKKQNLPVENVPPVPDVDAERLCWSMMAASRFPDPWMAPALRKLKASNRYLIAALSNTVIFPPGHEYGRSTTQSGDDIRSVFDVFVSSAHVGLRKPEPKMYELALKEVEKYAVENVATKGKDLGWVEGIKPEDIVFLDDIGENLKAAKRAGFGTIKVNLGRAYEAVEALEELTGLKLAGDHPKVPIKAVLKSKPKL